MEQFDWFSSYDKHVSKEFTYPECTLYEVLENTVSQSPNKVALRFFDFEQTYQEFFQRVHQFAAALKSLGVKKGDRVGIMLPNCPQYLVSYYASFACGAVVVQISPFYTKTEIRKIVKDSAVKVMICLDLMSGKISKIKEDCGVHDVVLVNLSRRLPMLKSLLYRLKLWSSLDVMHEDYLEHVLDFDHLLDHFEKAEAPKIDDNSCDDLAILQYTGGTTGLPKGAMLSHRNLVSNIHMLLSWTNYEEGKEKVLAVLPLFHSYGMTVSMNYSIASGGELILLPRFEASQVVETLQKHKPTFFPAIPTIYQALARYMSDKGIRVEGLKCCISGAAPLHKDIVRDFEAVTGCRLVEGFGLSEASPVTHCNPYLGEGKVGSIGLPFPGTQAKVVDMESGVDLPHGEAGELVICGPQVMQGYWKKAEEDVGTQVKNGWLFTGDIAKRDEDGYFYIVGRRKNMIIKSGLNIYPVEIEAVIRKFEGVEDVAAIGVPDSDKGELVRVFVVAKTGYLLSEKELDDFCRDNLAGYKCPDQFRFVEDLPKTLIGKTLYRKLREFD